MKAHADEKESDRRHIGELVRGATLLIWNTQISKKHRITDPRKLWPMPWDEPSEADEDALKIINASDEERNQMAQNFIDRLDGNKQSKP